MADGMDSLGWSSGAARVSALSRSAHSTIDRTEEVVYWRRLGQQTVYTAAGVVAGRGVDSDAFAVAERTTAARSERAEEVAELRAVALDVQQSAGDLEGEMVWMGPLQFSRQSAHPGWVDHDYGMRWGRRGDRRVSLRQAVGADRGLLYVYDPTWDEYGVLVRNVSVAAVEAVFSRAVQNDLRLSAGPFTAIIGQERATPDEVPAAVAMRPEL